MDDQTKTTVVLVEDETLFRELLRIALSQHDSLEVIGSFPDGESALREIPLLQPQVAILDIELGGPLNGIQVGLTLREEMPDLGIVILSNHGDPEFVASLPPQVIAGWSYLLKKSVSDVETIARAVKGVAEHMVVIDPQLVATRRPRPEGLLARLTPRQRDILDLIAQGVTNAVIAQRLVLTEKTVENQINSVYQQLGIDRVRSGIHPRVQAVLLYLQQSLNARTPH